MKNRLTKSQLELLSRANERASGLVHESYVWQTTLDKLEELGFIERAGTLRHEAERRSVEYERDRFISRAADQIIDTKDWKSAFANLKSADHLERQLIQCSYYITEAGRAELEIANQS